jgi:hypothetical protein
LVHDRRIDITIPYKKRSVIPARFKNYVPDLKNVSILQACEQTEREGMDFMYSSNQFYSKNDNTISKLAIPSGEMGTSCIQYLDLNTHFMMKIHNRHVYFQLNCCCVSPTPYLVCISQRLTGAVR